MSSAAPRAPGRIRIGTSGWAYPEWKGRFYPKAVREKDRLAWYAERFDTAEANGSFYRLPTPATTAAWAEQTPPDFVFAWKPSRFITQAKKLKAVAEPVALAYSRMTPLGDKRGPAIFQLPPALRLNLERLAGFLPLLANRGRAAVEFRHPSWFTDDVFALLAEHDVALCVSDHHDAPSPWLATASFVYVRGHGPGGHYSGRYPAPDLDGWAERIGDWAAAGRDVYAYLDNDVGGAAPEDAADLKARLGPGAPAGHQSGRGAS